MQYIILDLEAVGNRNDNDFMEIIEIAAYKITKEQLYQEVSFETLDTFHSYIKPVFHTMTKKIANLTHISFSHLLASNYYYEVMDRFQKWIGGEPFILICWSENDKYMLEENASRHFVNIQWLTDNYVDLQKQYDKTYMMRKKTSLSQAIKNQGLSFFGEQHCAKDDAYNTLILFQSMQVKYQQRL